MGTERTTRRGAYGKALYLAADSFLYCLLVYLACLVSLLAYEGLYTVPGAITRAVAVLAAAVMLEAAIHWTGNGPADVSGRRRLVMSAGWIVFFLLAFLAGPYLFVSMQPLKGSSNEWLPLDWVKFRYNFVLLARSSPPSFLAVLLVPAALITLRFGAKWRLAGLLLLGLLSIEVIYVLKYTFKLEGVNEDRDLGHFSLPMLVPLIGFAFGMKRLACRSLTGAWLFCVVGLFYVGVYPFESLRELNPVIPGAARVDVEAGKPPGVKKLYPAGGEDSAVLLSFLRDMTLDADGRHIYVSFGPTSGLLKVRTDGSGLAGIAPIHGVMRRLADLPGRNTILGLDFFDNDLIVFRKQPFGVVRRIDLFAPSRLSTPIDFEVDTARNRLYYVNYEGCALTEMELSTFRRLRQIRFPSLSLTRFRNGGQCLAYDAARRKIYVLLGFVDLDLGWRLVEVDGERMEVEGTVDLPYGGMEIEYFPETASVFTTSFWTDEIFEVRTEPFALARRIEGPLSCRNLAFDAKRRMIYASSYAKGDVLALSYDGGGVERTVHLGPKVSSLLLDARGDTLYAGCGSGIWALDLGRLFPAPPRPQAWPSTGPTP